MLCFGFLIELVLAFLFFAVRIASEIVAVLTVALNHPHLLYKSKKLDVGKGFCKPVSDHLFVRDVRELDSL